MHVLLLQANALRIPLASESVHCVVTSPPYWGLRDYGLPPLVWDGEAGCAHVWGESMTGGEGYASGNRCKWQHGTSRADSPDKWQYETDHGQFCRHCGAWRGCLGLEPTPEMYVDHLVQIFREVRRVLRADGTLWLNLGDSYHTGKDRSGHGGIEFQQRRAEAGVSFSSPAAHVGGHGKTRPQDRPHSSLKPKDMVGIPWRVAFALQADGWWLRSDIIWHKPNAMPESVPDRPTKAHEYMFLLAKDKHYFYDADAIREPHKQASVRRQERAISDRHKNADGAPGQTPHSLARPRPNINGLRTALEALDAGNALHPAGRNWRSVVTLATAAYSGAHFATYPPALVEPCIRAGTSERGVCPACGAPWKRVTERKFIPQDDVSPSRGIRGSNGQKQQQFDSWDGYPRGTTRSTTTGWQPTCDCDAGDPVPATVLDPFCGTGTTLMVARALGRRSIGLDLSFEYLHDQARERLDLRALEEWQNRRQVEATWHGLPLFAEMI